MMRAGRWLLGIVALAGGCNAELPPVATRCAPPGHAEAALTPESVAAALLEDAPSRLLLRADATAAILDMDGLVFLLPASEKRSTKAALTAALAPLPTEVRAAAWDRTAVVVWLGRGHGEHADPAPRLAWDPELRLDLVHDDLTDARCLVRVVTPSDPRHSLSPRQAARIAERAQRTEAKLVAALDHVAAPLRAEAVALRRAHDERLLFTSGIWAERQRTTPPAALVLIVVLLVFFGVSPDGALIVPAPPGQGYRVITYGLLHSGINHLTNNCIALYIGGFLLEPALGAARTILVFLAGVLGAGLARRFWRKPGALVGASGGTFALKGAALALVLMPAAWVPVLARSEFLVLLGVMLAMGILFSFLPTVSLLAHLAGAVAGALVALTGVITLGRPPLDGGTESALAANLAWAVAAVALLAWLGLGAWARQRGRAPRVW